MFYEYNIILKTTAAFTISRPSRFLVVMARTKQAARCAPEKPDVRARPRTPTPEKSDEEDPVEAPPVVEARAEQLRLKATLDELHKRLDVSIIQLDQTSGALYSQLESVQDQLERVNQEVISLSFSLSLSLSHSLSLSLSLPLCC